MIIFYLKFLNLALASAEELYQSRVTRIVTSDFPKYFAVITSFRSEKEVIGPTGGVVNSTVDRHVEAVIPQGAFTKKIRLGLQVPTLKNSVFRCNYCK